MAKKSQNRVGRPSIFKSLRRLERLIDKYFGSCWSQKISRSGKPIFRKDRNGRETDEKVMVQAEPYTVTGLALFLGTSRETICNYQNKDEFRHVIEMAKTRCEKYTEEQLLSGKNPAAAIFNLKNNFGWGTPKRPSLWVL